mgnify:FL=1
MLTKTNFLYILCVKLDSPNKRNASMYFLLFFYNHYHLTSRALSGFFFYESFSLHERKVWYDNSTNKGGQTMAFLPTTREEMLEQGFEQVDFVYVNGDAYVDHPSFGCAIITRVLQAYGYSCAILAQPDWHKDEEFLQFGEPRLGFLVSAGNIDSMVNHYSVNKRRRDHDAYSDEGIMGKRPDRPTTVYTQILKRLFPNKPVLIGGIEASLRRLSHYDYWDDKVRRSILMDSQADLLMYGMGETPLWKWQMP